MHLVGEILLPIRRNISPPLPLMFGTIFDHCAAFGWKPNHTREGSVTLVWTQCEWQNIFLPRLHKNNSEIGDAIYRLQRSCGKVMFSHLCVILFTVGSLSRGVSVWGGLCLRGSLSRGVSVQGISVQGVLCLKGSLCPEGFLSRRVSVQGGSVQGNLCPGGSLSRGFSVWRGVSVQGGFCPGGSLSRGSLSRGSLSGRPPCMVIYVGSLHPAGVHSCLKCALWTFEQE